MSLSASIRINDTEITPHDVNLEMQYHPADSFAEAQQEAARALVVRELLTQRVVEQGIATRAECERDPDACIDALLEQELETRTPDREEARRFFDNNRRRFFSSPVFDVSHILYPAPPEDEQAQAEARARAEHDLAQLQAGSASFAELARSRSACSSAADGGHLGPVEKGQTVPGFEAALLRMEAGELSAEPVASEVGYHLIQVHGFEPGQALEFDDVADWIQHLLTEQRWRHAFSQYVQLLAGQSRIQGFDLNAAETPLVQ